MPPARARPSAAAGNTTWQWQKNYRVWDANRRIFVTPENWLDPEPRLPPRVQAMLTEVVDGVVPDPQGRARGRRGAAAAGKGVRVLFSGGSSASALTAARVVASGLGRDLYRVDTSAAVSKYIGETEDNLDRVLASAGKREAVLFFDEADALFSTRTPVKSGRGRSVGAGAGELLQRIAPYEGLVILSARRPPTTRTAMQFQRVVSFQARTRARDPKRS